MTQERRFFASLIATLLLALPSMTAAETWNIDPVHSIAGFSVTHLMISNVHGNFEKIAGTIQYVPEDLKSAKADITIETATINTRKLSSGC